MRTKRPRRKGGPESLRAVGGGGTSDVTSEEDPARDTEKRVPGGGIVECRGSS